MSDHPPCAGCSGQPLAFGFSYAYQPIVDLAARQIFAHEALVRGPAGEGAGTVLAQVNADNRYRFDQACRVRAIETAARLGMQSRLSINFLPNAIQRPDLCIRSTLEAARLHGFPLERIIFESVEGERIADARWLAEVFREWQHHGFLTAIDDFGAGYAGLNLLADFQPDLVKLDMGLVRAVHRHPARQAIVRGVARICEELDIPVVAEGVEELDEARCLSDAGIRLMQGFLFCRPLFEGVGEAATLAWPALAPQAGGRQ
ncbi:EAL domain-containing protein [Azoarcus olearius]|uniref:EAL-domain containing protein n=1 Tax=Azoarcus sp. (strain BH72) TaxID=418699 RepID=A1K297_AZOSB|nr:EAL domain-containing protein [Azoarcus olearius]ANQ83425.1 EAL-domain-containing protein [Azoarcus olearius]CAL92952.1 EAL-domain containing protein [Azoarcus olearius]